MDDKTGIFDFEEVDNKLFDPLLAAMIYCLYKPKCMLDIGCGNGWYCRYFKDCFVPTVKGIEGNPDVVSIGIYGDILEHDLTKPINYFLPSLKFDSFDLVICLEVGEHIPARYEKIFIDNVVGFVSKFLVLSWAVPEQPGRGHVNLKTNRYVIEKMKNKGLSLDEKRTRTLREYNSLWWFKQSVMAFEKK